MSSSLVNQPIFSLRTDRTFAQALQPIINPHNLKIIGWWCKIGGKEQVLLAENVRDATASGLVVDDVEDLSDPADLARHKEVLEINFELIGKMVKTHRHKLGKVADYNYNDGFFVQQLYVARSLFKVFSKDDTLIIDRAQILEVTDKNILVRDTEVKAGQEETAAVPEAVSP